MSCRGKACADFLELLQGTQTVILAGDALFFHCNLLHCSSANKSEMRRWAFLCAYNKATNNPTKEHHHPRYTKLENVDNSAILACNDFTTMDGKWFLKPKDEERADIIEIGATDDDGKH